MNKTSILLVDDHILVREGLHQLLLTFDNIDVIGQAGNGYEAIKLAEKLKPDIIIIDISMPQLRGVEAIKEIKRVSSLTKILVLSMHDREEYIKQSLKNGASGYLLKNSASEELKSALSFILNDQIYLSPAISKSIVTDWLSESGSDRLKKENTGQLTNRETEVLKLLAEGYSNKEVASILHVSVKTIETHRYRIMEKLELQNFAALIKYAIKHNLIEIS
ncbi:response regulator transcription factor [candidate division KSB1 bacterium]|nr:response regulator transcription factor [candidate division KSB1 bacterium]